MNVLTPLRTALADVCPRCHYSKRSRLMGIHMFHLYMTTTICLYDGGRDFEKSSVLLFMLRVCNLKGGGIAHYED